MSSNGLFNSRRSVGAVMVGVPGPHPKNELLTLAARFRYRPEDCDCRYCLHVSGGGNCRLSRCAYLAERAEARSCAKEGRHA